jgi:hypothetical protein
MLGIKFVGGGRKPRTLLAFMNPLTDEYTLRREFSTNDGRISYIDRPVNGSVISGIGDHTLNNVAQKAQMHVGTFYEVGSGKSHRL